MRIGFIFIHIVPMKVAKKMNRLMKNCHGFMLGWEKLSTLQSSNVAAANSLERNKPTHELKAYVKTRTLKPNEKQMVTLTVKATDLASFNETKSAWIVDEGAYHFLLGASSRDIRATLSTDIKARETKVNNVLAPKEKLELLHR